MASRSDQMVCCICQYDFVNPKFLDCHHSICEKCVDDYIESVHCDRRISCPLCGRITIVPEEGAKMLMSNFYLEAQSLRNTGKVLACDVCPEWSKSEYRCKDCAKNMCYSCKNIHDKFPDCQRHRIVLITEIVGESDKKPCSYIDPGLIRSKKYGERERTNILERTTNDPSREDRHNVVPVLNEELDSASLQDPENEVVHLEQLEEEFFFRFSTDQIAEDFYCYRKFFTQEQQWYVSIHKDVDSETLWINLFLKKNGCSVGLKSCDVSLEFSVINNINDSLSVRKVDTKRFVYSDYDLCYNWRNVLPWNDLTDLNKGFMDEENSFTLSLQLDVLDVDTA